MRRRTHAAAVAHWTVKSLRGARHVARGRARSARKVEPLVAGARRWTRRHGRRAVRSAWVVGSVLHRKPIPSHRRIVFELQAGQVLMLETVWESGTAVRRQGTAVHRDRVAHDGGWTTADTGVCAFGIRMVATCVLGESGFAAERLAAACNKTLVRSPSRVDPPVTRQRARVRAIAKSAREQNVVSDLS